MRTPARSRVILVGIFDAVVGLMWILFCYPHLVAQMIVGAVLAASGFLLLWLAENWDAKERSSEEGHGEKRERYCQQDDFSLLGSSWNWPIGRER